MACINNLTDYLLLRAHFWFAFFMHSALIVCFLQNAMRATMEAHADSYDVPSIRVCVTKGKTDCGIKISDVGGGASREITSRWFEYLYSTAPRPPRSEDARVTPLVSSWKLYRNVFHSSSYFRWGCLSKRVGIHSASVKCCRNLLFGGKQHVLRIAIVAEQVVCFEVQIRFTKWPIVLQPKQVWLLVIFARQLPVSRFIRKYFHQA